MKTLKFAALILGFAPALLAAAPSGESLTGDLARLQGEWTVKAGPKRDIPVTLAIRGREVLVDVVGPVGLPIHAEGRIKIDETASPKTVDWVGFSLAEGQDMPEVLGLYELDGDSFKIVNGGPNDGRPSEFKRGDGVLADVLTFRRK